MSEAASYFPGILRTNEGRLVLSGGLLLPAGVATDDSIDLVIKQIQWQLDPGGNGGLIANVGASTLNGTTGTLLLEAEPDTQAIALGIVDSAISITALASDSNGSQITVNGNRFPTGSIKLVAGSSPTYTLLDQSQNSNYSQRTASESKFQQSGSGFVTFTNSTVSAAKIITHGIGRAPVVNLQITQLASGVFLCVTAKTTTTFTVQGIATGSLNQNVNFDWFVEG